MSFESKLKLALDGVDPLDVPLEAYSRLETLDRIVLRWSAKLDLIGFRTDEERMKRYFAEPLAASGWLPRGGCALDIGSGGGSPALPFAVVSPGLSWTLLEPRLKRRLFLEEAVRELGLDNVVVCKERFAITLRLATGTGLAAISTRGVRLSRPEIEKVTEALSTGGRFLWLGGGDRLREAAEWLARPGLRVDGPRILLPGSQARLLVVTREGQGS